ncbi:hypothetical protein SCUCBS95973_003146 [Sporothrix curviconia]|uniref:Zn(2)-C6 fungal-type domain-containing protein n=1 Tax=Sporothrix curviconia TaxID=1260050 RepID=A0ABP0BCR1_9PEZI
MAQLTSVSQAYHRDLIPAISQLPAPIACLECRRKHLRCDGTFPTCRRCNGARLPCRYAPSRRGRKRRHERPSDNDRSSTWTTAATTAAAASSPSALLPDTAASSSHSEPVLGSLHLNFDTSIYSLLPPAQDAHTNQTESEVSDTVSPSAGWMVPVDHQAQNNSWDHDGDLYCDDGGCGPDYGHDEKLVNLYYDRFHRCHPFLVPRRLYRQQQYPWFLRLAVQFIGSHYTPAAATAADPLRLRLVQMLQLHGQKGGGSSSQVERHPSVRAGDPAQQQQQRRRTVSMVQALLMFAVAAHARNEMPDSDAALARAVQLARDLGMHRRAFAASALSSLSSSPVEQESLRRTWWELYVVDGYLTALHHKPALQTADLLADVLLPCEEVLYEGLSSGGGGDRRGSTDPTPSLAPSLTITQFDERMFADQDLPFSSYSYRIDAVRLLVRVLSVTRTRPPAAHAHHVEADTDPAEAAEAAEAADHALAGWALHLRPGKRGILDARGHVDELLFQAQVLAAYAAMALHCPQSGLVATLPTAAAITCSGCSSLGEGEAEGDGDGDSDPESPSYKDTTQTRLHQHQHAVRAVDAACHITRLAALGSGPGRDPQGRPHTPFFVCALLLAATVQLADCVTHPSHRHQHRDRILLAVGLLKSLGGTWRLAHNALRLIRRVAGEILERDQQRPIPAPPAPIPSEALPPPRPAIQAAPTTGGGEGGALFPSLPAMAVADEPWVLPLMMEMDDGQLLSADYSQ